MSPPPSTPTPPPSASTTKSAKPTITSNPSRFPQSLKLKTGILTIAFATTIVVGGLYGATLRTKSDVQKETKKLQEASVEERIAVLEQSKKGLLAKRGGLERKIKQLEERRV